MIPIFIGIIIFTVIILSYKYDNIQNKKKKIVRIYLFAIAIFSVIWASSYLYRNFQEPHEWDFLCWYLDGSVAANGLNFYQPTSYQTTINSLVLPYAPSKAFISNIVDVGFKYPPPSMFYLITLGYLSYNGAHILWMSINIICIILCLYFLWKMFLPKKDLVTISLIVILFFLNKGTRWTLGVEQNTILLLLMLIFIWKDEESPRVGIWLAFGIIIKPIFAIILGYIAIKKNWKGLLVTFLIVSLLFIAAGLVFGSDVLYSYFNKNPNTDVPNVNYLEIVNCSLLATVLRVTNYDISIHPPLFNPLFLIISGIILIVSFLIIYINRNDSERWGLAYITVTGLLVYPATQQFYTILLIPFVFLLYKNIERLPGNIFSTAIIITFIYAFPQIDSNNIDVYFITHIIIWLILSAFLVAKSKMFSNIGMKLKTAQFNI